MIKHNKHVVTTRTFVHAIYKHFKWNVFPFVTNSTEDSTVNVFIITTNCNNATDFYLLFLEIACNTGNNNRTTSFRLELYLDCLLRCDYAYFHKNRKENILVYPTNERIKLDALGILGTTTTIVRSFSSHEKHVIYTTIACFPLSPPLTSSKRIMCKSFHADRSNCTSRTRSIYFQPALNRHVRVDSSATTLHNRWSSCTTFDQRCRATCLCRWPYDARTRVSCPRNTRTIR